MAKTLTLEDIGRQHGTDKVRHGYLPHLERHLAPLRDETFALLEIGVKDGASVRMWHDYFPRAQIVGLDITPRLLVGDLPRFVPVTGSQANTDLLTDLARDYQFRVVVDDGSHLWSHQIVSFRTLFPHTAPGAIYVCEDLHTSYEPLASKYADQAVESAASWFLRFADTVLSGLRSTGYDGAEPIPPDLARIAHRVEFIRGAVIITT